MTMLIGSVDDDDKSERAAQQQGGNMKYTKMHGLGNDFIFFTDPNGADTDYTELAKRLCHRQTGIGGGDLPVAVHITEHINRLGRRRNGGLGRRRARLRRTSRRRARRRR